MGHGKTGQPWKTRMVKTLTKWFVYNNLKFVVTPKSDALCMVQKDSQSDCCRHSSQVALGTLKWLMCVYPPIHNFLTIISIKCTRDMFATAHIENTYLISITFQ